MKVLCASATYLRMKFPRGMTGLARAALVLGLLPSRLLCTHTAYENFCSTVHCTLL